MSGLIHRLTGRIRKRLRRFRSTGARGERIAARALRRSGMRTLARNRRSAGVEIELVVHDPERDELVLVEVKTTADGSDGTRRINRRKRRRLARAAMSIDNRNRPVRVEAIGVSLLKPPIIRGYGQPPTDQYGR